MEVTGERLPAMRIIMPSAAARLPARRCEGRAASQRSIPFCLSCCHQFAGKDATEDFEDVGHSDEARSMMAEKNESGIKIVGTIEGEIPESMKVAKSEDVRCATPRSTRWLRVALRSPRQRCTPSAASSVRSKVSTGRPPGDLCLAARGRQSVSTASPYL